MAIELSAERDNAYHSEFPCGRNITILPNSCIQVKGRNPVSLVRKPLMSEARGSSTMFSSEN
jgi:hypothetical protein